MEKRVFYYDAYQHIYQRSVDCGVIFYTIEDYIVYYTIISVYSKKLRVEIIALCFMINHVHMLIRCRNINDMSAFIGITTTMFAKEYNKNIRRNGALFTPSYGSASKKTDRAIKACIAYILNNPVEKSICRFAQDYCWNFMSYSCNDNPFSTKMKRRECPASLRSVCDFIIRLSDERCYLSYKLLKTIFNSIPESRDESRNNNYKQLVVDHIIKCFSTIRYDLIYNYFRNYGSLLSALTTMTGSEYDIDEEWNNNPDNVYDELITITKRLGYFDMRGCFSDISSNELQHLVNYLQNNSNASFKQVCRFLHI